MGQVESSLESPIVKFVLVLVLFRTGVEICEPLPQASKSRSLPVSAAVPNYSQKCNGPHVSHNAFG